MGLNPARGSLKMTTLNELCCAASERYMIRISVQVLVEETKYSAMMKST